MLFTKPRGSRPSANEPRATEVVSAERITFYTLQTIFLLATIGLVYWIIAPAAIAAGTTLLGAFSKSSD